MERERDYTSIPSEEVGERIKDLIHEPSSLNLLENLRKLRSSSTRKLRSHGFRRLQRKSCGKRNIFNKGTFLYPQGFKPYGTS